MDNNKTLLEKINLPDEDRVHQLRSMVYTYLDTFRETEYLEEIKHMENDIKKVYCSFQYEFKKRQDKVSQLLLRCWKVSKLDSMGNPTSVMYIFPYKLLKTNDCLFALCSYIKPDYNSNNGLHEETFHIMTDNLFKDNDLLFEETTEEEMMENAKKSCEDALNERIWKLKYRDHVLE